MFDDILAIISFTDVLLGLTTVGMALVSAYVLINGIQSTIYLIFGMAVGDYLFARNRW